jgi:8-amino-7-oxononanoate synthase
MQEAEPQRQRLQKLILAFRSKITDSSLPVVTTSTPIQTIKVAGVDNAKALSAKLAAAGIDVRAILLPTVRRGEECLRVCLHAFNEPEDLDRLIAVLAAESEYVSIA